MDEEGLHRAVRDGDNATLKALLAAGAPVDAVDAGGCTALHLVAEDGNDVGMEALLAAGASVDAVDAGGSTPLHAAAQNGQEVTAAALVAAGAAVDTANAQDSIPLHLAALKKCDATLIRLLLPPPVASDPGLLGRLMSSLSGAERRRQRWLARALGLAARPGNASAVRVLVEAGASAQHVSPDNMAAVQAAVLAVQRATERRCWAMVAARGQRPPHLPPHLVRQVGEAL